MSRKTGKVEILKKSFKQQQESKTKYIEDPKKGNNEREKTLERLKAKAQTSLRKNNQQPRAKELWMEEPRCLKLKPDISKRRDGRI